MPDGGFEISFELHVAHPPEAVFEVLTDSGHFRKVDPALEAFGPEGPLTLGKTGWFRHRRGGMTARTTWAVTELEAPRRLVVAIDGAGYGMTESATLVATPTGTTATFVDRVWPTSLPGRILVALSGGIMRRDLRARAGRLKAVLEDVEIPLDSDPSAVALP